MIAHDRLLELLSYESVTGIFQWRRAQGRCAAGTVAGARLKSGYRQVKVDGAFYRAQRLAWFYMTGTWPVDEVDHENRVRDDNRWSNLREATRLQNLGNRGHYKTNTSGFKGVCFNRRLNRWQARIGREHLGYFETPEAAGAAYASVAERHFGITTRS